MNIERAMAFVHPGYPASRFFSTTAGVISSATAVPAVDTLYLYPFIVPKTIAITAGRARSATGGAASSMKAGVWANSSSNKPVGAPLLVHNTGVATTANNTTVALAMTGTLGPGMYWVGTKFTGTLPAMFSMSSTNLQMGLLAGTGTQEFFTANAISMADAYGNDMPTIAAGQSFTLVGSSGVPFIGFGT